MHRRELLRSSAIAGAGLILGHRTASAASANGSVTQAPSKTSPTLLSTQRILGRGDAALTVSALSLGCTGMHDGRGRAPDEALMERLIRQAYDRGCTFFDTAEGYASGRNEELLGRAIAPFRDRVIIGTKFTVDLTKNPPVNDNRPERIKAACEGLLRRLRTDVIDLYHQHRIDRSVPIEDVAGAVADLIKEGKVRRFDAPLPGRAGGASVTFEPGARTAWHTHPLGQTLIVISGAGKAQRWGGPIEDIRPGDVVWFPPGEKHWHGASPTTAMTHIAIQEKLDGKAVDWLEHVTAGQYRG